MAEVKTLLQIDDDVDLMALVKMKLEKTGRFSVVNSNEGAKAVSLAKEVSPDLIILDIEMPDMMGGEVAETLEADDATRDIPVVFLSSLITKEDAGEGVKIIGGKRMISKYVSVQQLIDAIDSILA